MKMFRVGGSNSSKYRTPLRAARGFRLRPQLEELETRRQLNAANPFQLALPITLDPAQPQIADLRDTTMLYAFSVDHSGRFVAELDPVGVQARLSLLNADGRILLQSDGQSPTDFTDRIDVHLTGAAEGTTFYLEITPLSGSGSYSLSTSFTTSTSPFDTAPVGTAPWSLVSADLNGDGHLDFAVANFNSNDVSVLYGLGDGTFGPERRFNVDPGPNGIVAGDFDQDGVLDLATANMLGGTVTILHGTGSDFVHETTVPVGISPGALAKGDFNNDGCLDLAVTDFSLGQVNVLLGSAGGFTTPPYRTYDIGAGPYGVALADFNGDGALDIATVNYDDDSLSLLYGAGDGSFEASVLGAISVGDGPYVIAVGDFNGDHRIDIATANSYVGDVSLLLNQGSGQFGPETRLRAGAGANFVSSADFDGDGNLDLVTTNFSAGTLSLFLGRGDGAFVSSGDMPFASDPTALAVGDYNEDGTLDLAGTNITPGDVHILFNRGDGTFQTTAPLSPGAEAYGMTGGDFNEDGFQDLVTVNYATNDLALFLGRGDSSFQMFARVTPGPDLDTAYAADFNEDGHLDLLVTSFSESYVTVLLGRGDGTFAEPVYFDVGSIALRAAVCDVNGDGKLDVISSDCGSDTISVLLGRGSAAGEGAALFQPRSIFAAGASPMGIATGDFNSDGLVDVAVANFGSGGVTILAGDGQGAFAPYATFETGGTPYAIVAGEFGGDDRVDLAISNSSSGEVQVWINQADKNFFRSQRLTTGRVPLVLLAEDLDGKHGTDLIAGSRRDSELNVFLRTDSGEFVAAGTYGAGTATVAGFVSDVNGDGIPDLMATGFSSSDFSVLRGTGDGAFTIATNVAIASGPVALASADFNSDGFLDVVSVNPTLGSVLVSLTGGDGTIRDSIAIALDGQPNAVVTGDFNGDGRTDLAVSQSAGDSVAIFLGIGDGGFRAPTFIAVGAHPSALYTGDFNGDGVLDLAGTNFADGTLTLLFGKGDGKFAARQTVGVGKGPTALAWGDIIGGGRSEFVVADSLSRTLSIVGADSRGVYALVATRPLGFAPVALALGDFTCDGTLDIAIADPGGNVVTLLIGQGNGTFAAATIFAGMAPTALAAGDFNNDGYLDLAVANNDSNDVVLLLGDGAGELRVASSYAVGAYPLALAACDFNNDGRLDVATANALGVSLSIGLGIGNGQLTEPGAIFPTVQSRPIIADFNGDGIRDVVVLAGNGEILFRAGRPDLLTFDAPIVINPDPSLAARDINMGVGQGMTYLVAANSLTGSISFYICIGGRFVDVASSTTNGMIPSHIQIGDVNGDGRDDLIMTMAETGELSVYLQKEVEDFSDRPADYQIPVGIGVSDIAITDTDGDGRPELVVTDQRAGVVRILRNTPTSPFTTSLVFRAGSGLRNMDASLALQSTERTTALVVGDFNGDAIPDLAVLQRGMHRVDVLLGDGQGGVYAPAAGNSLVTGLDPVALVAADFNRDGRVDLAVLNRGSADLSIFLGNGGGGFEENGGPRPGAGNDPAGLTAADINGDGRIDLLVGNTLGDVLAMFGRGDGAFEPYQRTDQHVALAVADFANNGTPQFVLVSEGRDRVTVGAGNAAAQFEQGRQDGVLDPNAVTLADLNGDGFDDLVVVNGGGNNILAYLGLGMGRFGAAQSFFVGTDPQQALASDLNGDGILDLVVANHGSNDVSILFGQGRADTWTLTPGPRLEAGAGPVAVAARDLNGDGIADLLVLNRDSSNVYELHGVGGGFFNDAHPTIYQTGLAPVRFFVGNFDHAAGLDLVTIDSGSKDMSFFSGFGAAQKIALSDSTPVAAVAQDLNHDGYDDLIVAERDGRFSLLVGAAGGLELAHFMVENLVNISDLAVWSVTGSSIQMYVSLDGWDGAASVLFDFSQEIAGAAKVSLLADPATSPTEFSALSSLDLVAILSAAPKTALRASPDRAAAASVASEREEPFINAGEMYSVILVEDEAETAAEAGSEEWIAGNALISGTGEIEPDLLIPPVVPQDEIPFLSPLDVYEDRPGRRQTPPPQQSLADIVEDIVAAVANSRGGLGAALREDSSSGPLTGKDAVATESLPSEIDQACVMAGLTEPTRPRAELSLSHISAVTICLSWSFLIGDLPRRSSSNRPLALGSTRS